MLVRLLGGVEIASDTDQWRTVPGKRGGVLAVLAVAAGQPVPADELAHRVWGDAAVELGTSAVYPHITRLRAMLPADGAVITRSGGGYVLGIAPEQIDLLDMRRQAAGARADAEAGRFPGAVRTWRQAAALVRGEALAGVDGDWARRVRRQFNAEVTSMLTERFDCELRLGRHAAVVDELLAVVTRHPNCEPLAELLMLALYRCGRQAEAIEVFVRTESRLRELLGIDASTSFRKLHRQVLNQDESIAAPREVKLAEEPPEVVPKGGYVPPAQLPAPPRGFVGREDAVADLMRGADRASVLVVDGMPGVGKTAIAVYTAAKLAEWYPDGQLYVELHGYSGDRAAVAPGDALARMLRGLGAAEEAVPAGLDERAGELRTRLAGRRVLIVLDNALDAAQVRPLLAGYDGCLTIVTSRRRLPELLDSEPVTLDVLEREEAVRLLVSAVGDPRRATEDSAGTTELVEAAGRLPLAVRLIAARLRNRRSWTTEFMLRRLRERAILDELSSQDINVAAAFSMSYAELDPGEQRMFRLLGLYPGQDFDVEFAAVLAGVDPDDADRVLEELVDAHLLHSDEPGRYRFHDLMRQFAVTIAAESETSQDLDAARRRLYDAAVVWLRDAVTLHAPHRSHFPTLVDPDEPPRSRCRTKAEAVAWIRTDLANLRAMTQDVLARRMDPHCAELAAALCDHLNHFRGDHEAERVAQWGLESSLRMSDERCESYFLTKHATALVALGDLEQAERQHKQALDVRRRLGDPRFIVHSLVNLSMLYAFTGEWSKVVELRGEAVDIAQANDLAELAYVRLRYSYVLCEVGETAEAGRQLEQVEALLAETEGTEHMRMVITTNWGIIRRREGRPGDALPLDLRALEFFRSQEDVLSTATLQAAVARDLVELGRWDEAHALATEAVLPLNERTDTTLRAVFLTLLSEVCLHRGGHGDALEQLREAEAVARDRRDANLVAEVEWGMARARRGLGDESGAVDAAERALAYFSRFDMPQVQAIRDFLADG